MLCELEGLSRRQAAVRLGVSEGTLSSRLARGKARLRDRLTRRGLALSTMAIATAFAQDAQAVSVPPALVDSTIRCAALVAAGSSLAGVVSTSVTTLTEGVLKAMLVSKLKIIGLGIAALVLVTGGVGVVAQDRPSNDDRLRALEQKLDRLIEVLGGSNRPVWSPPPRASATPAPSPVAPPPPPGAPALPPVPPLPVAVGVAPSAPLDNPPPPATVGVAPLAGVQPGALPTPAATPVPPQTVQGPGGRRARRPYVATQPAPRAPQAEPISLEGRVRALEDRLTDLERRFTAFQQQVLQAGQGPRPERFETVPALPVSVLTIDVPSQASGGPPILPPPAAPGQPSEPSILPLPTEPAPPPATPELKAEGSSTP